MSSISAFPSRGLRVEVIRQHAARGASAIIPELTSLTREIRDIINSRTKVINTIKARLRNIVFANAGIKKANPKQRSAASDEANAIYDAIVGLKPLTPKQEVYAAIVGPYAEAVRNFDRREHELEFEIVDRVGALGDLARWVEGVKGASPLGLGQILGCMGRLPHEFRSKRGMWKWMGLAVMHGGPHDGGGRAQGNVKNIPAGSKAKKAYKDDKYSRSNRTTVAVMLNPLFNQPKETHYRAIALRREEFELAKIPEAVKAKGEDADDFEKRVKGRTSTAASRAKRYVHKLFLHDLYAESCRIYGVPLPPPMPAEFGIKSTQPMPAKTAKRAKAKVA